MYLRPIDYLTFIQDAQRAQIVGNNDSVRIVAEQTAQEEMLSYLSQKYDIEREFRDLNIYNPNVSYKALDRIYLDGSPWAAGSYNANTIIIHIGLAYIAIVNTTTSPLDQVSDWFYLGRQYDMFYTKLPKPEFNYKNNYTFNDEVFWKDKTWIANQGSRAQSHFGNIQDAYRENIGLSNVAPTDSGNQHFAYWKTPTDYSVPTNTLPTNLSFWTSGDSRSQQLKMYLIFITIFRIARRIAPNNVPARYEADYNETIEWLKMAAKGEITANLPLIQPKQGQRVRFGGMVKHVNFY